MKNLAALLSSLVLAMAVSGCDDPPLTCGVFRYDEARMRCVCPEGTTELADGSCMLPDGGIIFPPGLDAGSPNDAGLDAAMPVDSGRDSGGADACALQTFYRDSDDDGAGDPATSIEACVAPIGYVDNSDDCDDTCMTCVPGGTEVCDGEDNDCDESVDEGTLSTFFRDADADTFGDPTMPMQACVMPAGYVDNSDDCNDGCMDCFPGGVELCEGALDEDCSMGVDNGCGCTIGTMRACPGGSDVGECVAGTQTCSAVGEWGACVGSAGPALETCNGRDDDCDSVTDGPTAAGSCGSAPRVTSVGCTAGTCVATTCVVGWDDCDDNFSNGCEANLATSEAHCGSCDSPCDWSCGGSACEDGSSVGVGSTHSCAVLESGRVACWGSNASGELGLGTAGPAQAQASIVVGVGGVGSLSGVSQVDGSAGHTCARLSTGTVVCWGANNQGQLGDGTTMDRPYPVAVPGLAGVLQVTTGNAFSCALLSGGSVRCWGANGSGQLGNSMTSAAPTTAPVTVTGLSNATQLDAGQSHVCARTAVGVVRCWGLGSGGRLGNGGTSSQSSPVLVTGISTASEVTAGDSHSCALLADGSLRCWGLGGSGQLGNGASSGSTTPVAVVDIAGATSVRAGAFHSCATIAGGAAMCWGAGSNGALGNGGLASSSRPVTVSGISGVTSMDVGGNHACVVLAGGRVSCWGRGTSGEVGDGLSMDRSTATAAVGP